MSGVWAGSRLEQLRALHARIEQEITAEELREATDGGRINPHGGIPAPKPYDLYGGTTEDALARLNVTALVVKEWAVAQGLLAAVTRGRVSRDLVIAYAHAHARTRGDHQ